MKCSIAFLRRVKQSINSYRKLFFPLLSYFCNVEKQRRTTQQRIAASLASLVRWSSSNRAHSRALLGHIGFIAYALHPTSCVANVVWNTKRRYLRLWCPGLRPSDTVTFLHNHRLTYSFLFFFGFCFFLYILCNSFSKCISLIQLQCFYGLYIWCNVINKCVSLVHQQGFNGFLICCTNIYAVFLHLKNNN